MSEVCQEPVSSTTLLVLVTGAAGSGKTTLGRALARELRLALLDLDSVTNPLLDALTDPEEGAHWLAGPRADAVRAGRYAALLATAADIVGVGGGAVLVAPFTAELRGGAAWEAVRVAATGATLRVVHLEGAAELLAARRAARGEARDAHRTDAGVVPPAVPHLAVPARLPTAEQLDLVLAALRG